MVAEHEDPAAAARVKRMMDEMPFHDTCTFMPWLRRVEKGLGGSEVGPFGQLMHQINYLAPTTRMALYGRKEEVIRSEFYPCSNAKQRAMVRHLFIVDGNRQQWILLENADGTLIKCVFRYDWEGYDPDSDEEASDELRPHYEPLKACLWVWKI